MTMHAGLAALIAASGASRGGDGIYSGLKSEVGSDQDVERRLREGVAARAYDDYLGAIAQSHSIPVMDHEVDRFLAEMPQGALILDVGGCWGWHWRRLATTRTDVAVLIVDFVRPNLLHAERVLGPLVGSQVALMHADATALPFPDASAVWMGFDGVWTVQVFQHIPDFDRACREAHRVLKHNGRFVNYSLHITPLYRAVYGLLRRRFHLEGMIDNVFHLTRANDQQRDIVARLFGAPIVDRYTECLFHPEMKFGFTARAGSLVGRLDALLGGLPWIGRWIARQRSFEATKP